jgi:DNA replication and repair protein RecF
LDPAVTIFTGGNGAGKTSLLEAIYVLGRGRSFRSPDGRSLIRDGTESAEISADIIDRGLTRRIGARVARDGLSVFLDGHRDPRLTDLARMMPVLSLDAGTTELVQGSPDNRRRLMDWGLFHVEQNYLEVWRHFRRALSQRNAGLRAAASAAELDAWDREYLEAAAAVDAVRQRYAERLSPVFRATASKLLDTAAEINYMAGWRSEQSLAQVIEEAREGDRAQGVTRFGPHRGDLTIQLDSSRARARSSRGQQKLLGAALILSQARLVAGAREDRVILLVDEPEADLDRTHTGRLVTSLRAAPVQLVVAAIERSDLLGKLGGAMFHVEHGEVKALL